MIVLAIRTDKPEAELYIFDGQTKLAEKKWQAHKILADTINIKTEEILNKLSISWNDVDGIVCYEGPGSFTGLRIGIGFANALAYAQNIPIVTTKGDNWMSEGIEDINSGKNQKIAAPYYDRPAATTQPKK